MGHLTKKLLERLEDLLERIGLVLGYFKEG